MTALCGAGLARLPVWPGLEPVQHSLAANVEPVGVGLGGLAVSLVVTGLRVQTRRRYLRGSLVIAAIAVVWFSLPTVSDRRAAVLLGFVAFTLFVSVDPYRRAVQPHPVG